MTSCGTWSWDGVTCFLSNGAGGGDRRDGFAKKAVIVQEGGSARKTIHVAWLMSSQKHLYMFWWETLGLMNDEWQCRQEDLGAGFCFFTNHITEMCNIESKSLQSESLSFMMRSRLLPIVQAQVPRVECFFLTVWFSLKILHGHDVRQPGFIYLFLISVNKSRPTHSQAGGSPNSCSGSGSWTGPSVIRTLNQAHLLRFLALYPVTSDIVSRSREMHFERFQEVTLEMPFLLLVFHTVLWVYPVFWGILSQVDTEVEIGETAPSIGQAFFSTSCVGPPPQWRPQQGDLAELKWRRWTGSQGKEEGRLNKPKEGTVVEESLKNWSEMYIFQGPGGG